MHLIYYVDYDIFTRNKLSGFRVIARPSYGFAFYKTVEYHSDGVDLNGRLKPNETFYVEIQLRRCVDKSVFRLDGASRHKLRKEGIVFKADTRDSFKDEGPLMMEIDNDKNN